LQGYGTKEEPAFMTFYRDKRPFIITAGLRFSIEPERITSDDVSVRIRMDKDSLYHPSVSMRFLRDKNTFTLIKKDEGLSKAPFYNTYHQLGHVLRVLTWKQGDPLVQMGNLQGSTHQGQLRELQLLQGETLHGMLGIDAVHPLVRLNDFSKQNGGKFYAQEFAVFSVCRSRR
jgi:hypothetical protein